MLSQPSSSLHQAALALFRGARPLAVIAVCFGLAATVAILSLRQHGLSQDYARLNHPLLDPTFVLVALDGGSGDYPPNTQAAFDATQAVSKNIWLHVSVRRCADELVAFRDPVLQATTDGEGPLEAQTFAQLQSLDAGAKHPQFRGKGLKILSLDQVLERYPETPLVIDIHSNLIDIHKQVIAAVERRHADQRVLIQSDHDVILTSIKELRPLWLYGTSRRDLTRSHILSSFYLASMAPLWGDVFITPNEMQGHDVLRPDLISEVHRRQKKIFVQGPHHPQDLSRLLDLGIDGVITDQPSALWRNSFKR